MNRKNPLAARTLLHILAGVLYGLIVLPGPAWAARLDASMGLPTITDGSGAPLPYLTDGYGLEPWPVAANIWTRSDRPTSSTPSVLVLDYGRPLRIAALVNHCWRPGSRDQRTDNFCFGPASFRQVNFFTSDNGTTWTLRAQLADLPSTAPQVLRLPEPIETRFLRLEAPELDPAARIQQTYEITTYIDEAPAALPAFTGDSGRAIPHGFPAAGATDPTTPTEPRAPMTFDTATRALSFDGGLAQGQIEIWGDDAPVPWEGIDDAGHAHAMIRGGRMTMAAQHVRTGLLLTFEWNGPDTPPVPRLDVVFRPGYALSEFCVPAYHYGRTPPEPRRTYYCPAVSTAVAMAGDTTRTLTVVPDSDQGWVGVHANGPMALFPLRPGEPRRVLLLSTRGDWYSGFEKAITEVFDFEPPRQFSPVSDAIPELCRFLMDDRLWSAKYQMLRSFPDTDFFYIFYSLPYAIPALCYWETMSGDPAARDKIDKILRFTLARRLPDGPMKGAIYSQYADWELAHGRRIPHCYGPYLDWVERFPQTDLVGMDQGANRWITSHTAGSVLWAATQVWLTRGALASDIMAGAREVADWLVSHQTPEGAWQYAWTPEGQVAVDITDSASIWNVWALWRFGNLTGEPRYQEAARKGLDYFKTTFTNNHLYRGYWEDNFGGYYLENKPVEQLNTAQGYEASLAAACFSEVGDNEALASSARDAQRFICTRVLESRDYFTSLGGASEQQGWAPGTYIAPTFSYASHLAWRRYPMLDAFRRFSGSAKAIGWWQDPANGGAFWLGEAISQNPIHMFRQGGGGRQFWALWDSAQKVAFCTPWLVDEVNRMSGDRVKIDLISLRGRDERGYPVMVRLYPGRVESASGQVNWVALNTPTAEGVGRWQLALLNHAEATTVRLAGWPAGALASARRLSGLAEGEAPPAGPELMRMPDGGVEIALPAESLIIVE